jgi:four helix bundle protein
MGDAPDNGRVRYPLPAIRDGVVSETQSNPVREKSFEFALAVVELRRRLVERHEYDISKQLMRSGTAVGALIEEAVGAESRKDFLHKMSIAHKEARESHYWLRLLSASGLLRGPEIDALLARADELVALLMAITRTVKDSIRT